MNTVTRTPLLPPLHERADERAARADVKAQIARLDAEIGALMTSGAALPARAGRGRRAGRLLSLAELERTRDALVEQAAEMRRAADEQGEAEECARRQLEHLLLDPGAHRFERVDRAAIGAHGCGGWHVRPRFGLLGMLANWWRVVVSSGCPLCSAAQVGAEGAIDRRAADAEALNVVSHDRLGGRQMTARLTGVRLAGAAALATTIAALATAAPAAADWPVYGHDLANTRDAGSAGPARSQVGALARAWTFNSSTGDFTGTPVVAGGVIVAGNNGGWVYALSAATGRLLWSKDVGQPVNGSAAIDLHAPAGPTAFVPIAAVGGPRLLALALANGATRWDAVLTNQSGSDVFGSPVYWRGGVYIGTSGPNNDNSTARGSVVAVDELTGHLRWQTFTVPPGRDGAAVWSTPAIDTATGRLYVGTGNNYHQPTTGTEDSVMALDGGSGRILGHFQATANDAFTASDPAGPDYDFGASPNLLRGPTGEPLVGEGQKSGVYWALDRTTMKPVWSRTAGPGGPLGGLLGSTAFDGTRIYGADTLSGQVFALSRAGTTAWTSLETGAAHLGATTVANGVVYTVDPAGFLTARDPAAGTLLAKLPLGGPSFGGVSAAGGAVYAAVGTGPPPAPAPQQDGAGSIVAFGNTSR